MIDQLQAKIANFTEPATNQTLKELNALKSVNFKEGCLKLELAFGFPIGFYQQELSQAIGAYLNDSQIKSIDIKLSQQIKSHAVQTGLKPIPGVKNILAISSAKGGVGKSTCAMNMAFALQALGARVGLLDADIYGPSQPHMLNTNEQPKTENNKLFPVNCSGIQTMSIGYLVEEDTPVIWRGPMVTRALQQLLQETLWDNLDYLVLDMPPGTGDIQLTLAQKIPVSGAVIITTPQPIACLDAVKGLQMFNKVKVPILGLVENMAEYHCEHCGQRSALFGTGGGQAICQQHDVRFLGAVPLDIGLRQATDDGYPVMKRHPESASAQEFMKISRAVGAQLAIQSRDYAAKFPEIVIENN